MNTIAQTVMTFWFGNEPLTPQQATLLKSRWFQANADTDYDVERRFGKLVGVARQGGLARWADAPQTLVALVLLLDQFPRNLYRGTANAFRSDDQSLALAKHALANDFLRDLSPIQAVFALMPFQHTESIDDQYRGVQAYEALAESVDEAWQPTLENFTGFARRHLAVIEQFGRFPHRNAALGRASTSAEEAYLTNGGETF